VLTHEKKTDQVKAGAARRELGNVEKNKYFVWENRNLDQGDIFAPFCQEKKEKHLEGRDKVSKKNGNLRANRCPKKGGGGKTSGGLLTLTRQADSILQTRGKKQNKMHIYLYQNRERKKSLPTNFSYPKRRGEDILTKRR